MVYIGCSGWQYKEWKKAFYPENLSLKGYLQYYCKSFGTVEVNNTFYRLPTKETVTTWYQNAPQGFKYSIKASRYITHLKRFHDVEEPVKLLYNIANILAEKTGCFLFQLPKNLQFTPEKLKLIIKYLNPDYRNILEFRHPSWWDSEVTEVLSASKIGFCTVSGFNNLPEDLMVINNKAYIRFHGNETYSSSYSAEALSKWADKIKTAAPDEVWIYFNNTANGYAPQNALQLQQILQGENN